MPAAPIAPRAAPVTAGAAATATATVLGPANSPTVAGQTAGRGATGSAIGAPGGAPSGTLGGALSGLPGGATGGVPGGSPSGAGGPAAGAAKPLDLALPPRYIYRPPITTPQRSLSEMANEQLRRKPRDAFADGIEAAGTTDCLKDAPDSVATGLLAIGPLLKRAIEEKCRK